ncbi:helix-turn-helix transcriptional regulator [Streptomyces sp. NPDC002911]
MCGSGADGRVVGGIVVLGGGPLSAGNELFGAVDALLQQVARDGLPAPAERKRLREAAGLSQAQVATALEVRREAVGNWESGKAEPRRPKRAAYARLLAGLAERLPASGAVTRDGGPRLPVRQQAVAVGIASPDREGGEGETSAGHPPEVGGADVVAAD